MPQFSALYRGDPRLPPLIFLHGFLGCKEDWEGMIPCFEEHYHCIALDLPGHGETPYCDEIILAIRTEIQQMTSQRPMVIGYSLGGRIALQLENVAEARIILSGHPGLTSQREKQQRLEIDRTWSKKLTTLPFAEFLQQWDAQPLFQQRQPVNRRCTQQHAEDLAKVILQMSLANQPLCNLHECPALFLYGEYDLKYRDLYSNLSETIAVRCIDNSSHAVHLDNPLACATTILNWINSHANHRRDNNS